MSREGGLLHASHPPPGHFLHASLLAHELLLSTLSRRRNDLQKPFCATGHTRYVCTCMLACSGVCTVCPGAGPLHKGRPTHTGTAFLTAFLLAKFLPRTPNSTTHHNYRPKSNVHHRKCSWLQEHSAEDASSCHLMLLGASEACLAL